MAHRSIEEVFGAIAPSRRRGIPSPAPIGVGLAGGDIGTSMSQAAQEIAQLRATYQQQAALIQANTQALTSNTSAQGVKSAAGQVASSFLGGGLGFLSPVISGIASLFGGGHSAPPPLNVYTPPPPVDIGGILHSPQQAATGAPSTAATQPSPAAAAPAPAPQITVNVSAMDSRSFLDRSTDIANAVREAMLNNHPINGVVASL